MNNFEIIFDSICRESGGTICCSGTYPGPPRLGSIWGKVVPQSNNESQNNPWDDETTNDPTPGTVKSDTAWTICGMGQHGTATACKVFVWGLEDDGSIFETAANNGLEFDLSGGSGSGSGSGSGIPDCSSKIAISKPSVSRSSGWTSFGALPRVYRLQCNVRSLGLSHVGSQYLAEGLLQSGAIHLTHAADVSLPDQPVWRATNLADANAHWTLQLRRVGQRVEATLALQRAGDRKMLRPLLWRSQSFNIMGGNTLRMVQGSFRGPFALTPVMRIRPA